jgi:hypothetical protein
MGTSGAQCAAGDAGHDLPVSVVDSGCGWRKVRRLRRLPDWHGGSDWRAVQTIEYRCLRCGAWVSLDDGLDGREDGRQDGLEAGRRMGSGHDCPADSGERRL